MAELKTREQVAQEFKWNVESICATDELWQQRFDATAGMIAKVREFEARLGKSGTDLLACLKTWGDTTKEVVHLYLYANLKGDEDTANPTYQGMRDKAQGAFTSLRAAASFIEPSIIALGEGTVADFVASTPGLEVYKHMFHNLFRKEKHILSPEIEELLAKAGEIGSASSNIYSRIIQTDMTFGKVKDSEGKEHEVTIGRFGSLMQSMDRVLRKNTHELYYDRYIAQKNTIAEAYNYSVKNDIFKADARKYEDALSASLFEFNIPTKIYTNLVDTISANIHLFHRYLDIRKRCLGVDTLEFYDIYAPIVEGADITMNWEEAKKTVHAGVAALGSEYQALVQKSYDESWIDVYENKGKRTGAYQWSHYGTNPFVLMNYDDTIGDMFTLAHELGHAMHSYYTYQNQPYPYANYTIFLAEVASTVNENLVMDHMLAKTDDKTKRLYLLNEFLEGFKGTVFRQTMFAEFEMLTHQMASRGEPLNSQSLNNVYKGLLEKYFGDKIIIDERIIYEWSRIPHFYRAFYVYQYSTGYASAVAFAKAIRDEGAPAVEKYLGLLKSGSSDYSVELLKKAGVDMTTPAPIQAAMDVFKEILDMFEEECFG
ncbi:MAG: oligoendopeptidase F [Defluviitaleaceae bacterium]|nr:oligoendopeptidase F [Defluviitaleaceae bacterium]